MPNEVMIILGMVGLCVVVTLLLKKPLLMYFAVLSQKTIDESIKAAELKTRELLQEGRDRIIENIDGRLKLSEQSLEAKKDLITEAVNNVRNEVRQSQERLIKSDQARVAEFGNLKTTIEQHISVTESLHLTTDALAKILSNNQLRGGFGQEVAGDLLKMAGFVKGENYLEQARQETTANTPDFTVLMPDGAKVNIDVRFPFQALQRYKQTEDKAQQQRHLHEFKSDIKTKIKEVTTRNYISPEENTMNFVVMFIPNEMIFSFIYEKFPDVWHEAIKNKVIMCGPFSFTAILRMVQRSYDNFKYQKDLHTIITHIKSFDVEYGKFSKEFDKLGKHISQTQVKYEEVAGVRDKQLTRIIEKIKTGEVPVQENIRPALESGVLETLDPINTSP